MSIVLDKVSHIYDLGTANERFALKDISLQIKDGEFIGLIGHTGSGKSTLVQHLNGLLKANYGTVYYNGEDIYAKDYSMKKLRQKVGLVFQYPEHQLFETTVIKDVKFGPKNMGLPQLEVDMRAFEALKQVGIGDDLLDASPFELSGGQRRRVAIAGILAMQPEVLILDEPTAGLDPKGREEILEQIARLHKERNITIILVSHSMEDVAKYAQRLLVMNRGRVVLDGAPQDIFPHYEEIEKIGLAAPQITYVMQSLKEAGLPVDTSITDLEQAVENICRYTKNVN
ncbi:MAG: energy-coupling factor transporter ATPase [Lachnospiraceae bacterium]|nr:energy-coupling factor transporter ATPase [Lachnospiraceae bacterium]